MRDSVLEIRTSARVSDLYQVTNCGVDHEPYQISLIGGASQSQMGVCQFELYLSTS